MGHNKKREFLIKIITKLLETNIELMEYYHYIASDTKSKRICSKSVRQSRLAIEKLPHVKHVEILQSLYNTLIAGKESVFVSGGSLICSKKFYYYDNTDKGFAEFMELEKEAQEKQKAKIEEQRKTQEAIKKAKEQGKKVEMVYKDGKVQPVIVENDNA